MNLGLKCAEGRYICLISDDSVVHPDTIGNGVRRFDRERATGRKLGGLAFYWRSWPEESSYRVCFTFSDRLMVNHGLFLAEAVREVGWIDEERYDFYCADGDLSLRLWQAGYEVERCEDAVVEHFERAGIKLREGNLSTAGSDWDKYVARWTGIFFDPDKPYSGRWDTLPDVQGRDAAHLFPACAGRSDPVGEGGALSAAARRVRRLFRLVGRGL
jgi:hypothetical protein